MSFWTFASVAVIAFIVYHIFPETVRMSSDKVRADFVVGCMGTQHIFTSAAIDSGAISLRDWCAEQSVNYGIKTLGEQ